MNDARWQWLTFPQFTDARGWTMPVELDGSFPFVVKRWYLVTANEGQVRGGHAHIEEEEVFVAIGGSIRATLHDGETAQQVTLDDPSQGLHVRTGCWHEFDQFSPGATLLCLSSTPYMPGEGNYITDRGQFWKH